MHHRPCIKCVAAFCRNNTPDSIFYHIISIFFIGLLLLSAPTEGGLTVARQIRPANGRKWLSTKVDKIRVNRKVAVTATFLGLWQ
jgi:hypothetical protein